MKVSTWKKDMAIIAEFADDIGCATPLFTLTQPVYTEAMAMGLGDQDTAAVFEVLKKNIIADPKPGARNRIAFLHRSSSDRRATRRLCGLIEDARSEYRTASKVAGRSIPCSGCKNFRQARSMAWLSLDHLSLPSDKSLKQ
jgi:hypothetical protein